ncbi:MAG: Crp/Fnr family transcriptional regulator [Bradymonadaceae bacterium]|nr:Crp/Fnr family transcriptional regulator [Lujinxingiaceae bacterium]
MNKLALLRELSFFENVPDNVLAPLADYFISRRYERGDYLWREGATASNFTFVIEGQVKVVKIRSDAREVILGIFGPDEAVGHLAVYKQIPYPASLIALEDTLVLEIFRGHFYGTIQRHTPLLEAVLRNMMARNHDLVQRMNEVTVCSAEQRLALIFSKFSESVGKRVKLDDGTWGVFIDLPLSRNDICELINVRVETAIRLMSKWNKEGPMRTEKRGFTVIDAARLEALATSCD